MTTPAFDPGDQSMSNAAESSSPADAADASWQPLDQESALLARRLRAARLTVLFPRRHAAATSFLLHGVEPQLRRRASDHTVGGMRPPRVIIPFPDQRGLAIGSALRPGPEISVVLGDWTGEPLVALRQAVIDVVGGSSTTALPGPSLVDTLSHFAHRDNSRFLFVFDGFETCLRDAANRREARAFLGEWIEILRRPGLAANFLLALTDEGIALLKPLIATLPSVEEDCVVFSTHDGRVELLPFSPSIEPADAAEPVHASIDADLPWHDAAPVVDSQVDIDPSTQALEAPPEPTPETSHAPIEVVASPIAAKSESAAPAVVEPVASEAVAPEPVDAPPASPSVAVDSMKPWRWYVPLLWGLALSTIAIGPAIWWLASRDRPTLQSESASIERGETRPAAPPTARPVSTLPSADILIDSQAAVDARTAGDLQRFVSTAAGLDLRSVATADSTGALVDMAADTRLRFAIATYAQAQAAGRRAGPDRLSLMTPLYTDDILFIVRADAPHRFIHDIEGLRIDAGPPGSARAAVADAAYRRLFGADRPPPTTAFGGLDAAVEALLANRGIDAIVVSGQAPDWLDRLPAASRRELRLLQLDRKDPRDRRAMQSFLPSTVRHADATGDTAGATSTLSVLSFLVTNARRGDDDAASRVAAVSRALCESLPRLRREGQAPWSQVKPGLVLPSEIPFSSSAQAGFRDCDRGTAGAAPR